MADADRARAMARVERVLKLRLMDDARAATRVFGEVSLSGGTANGETQGRAGLLFETDGKWRVVEFKTDVASQQVANEHADQLSAYATNVAALLSAPVRPVFCHVAGSEVVALRSGSDQFVLGRRE